MTAVSANLFYYPRKVILTLIWLIPSLLWISEPLIAQSSMEITILEKSGKQSVPGIAVQLENKAIGYSKSRLSNSQGNVRFEGLSTSGEYSIMTPGTQIYRPVSVENIHLESNHVSSVIIVLTRRKQLLPQITVSAPATRLNTVNAELSGNLDRRQITTIPVQGRDVSHMLYRLPDITPATGFFPEAPVVSINGTNPLYTYYSIDGLGNNENFLGGMKFPIPLGFTQHVQALTGAYSSQYGWSGSGVINITSRSGSNITSGEAYYEVRPGPVIDASSPFSQRDLSGNAVKNGFQRHQFGFDIGGPIIHDKTFYFVNVEQTIAIKDNLLNVPDLGVNQTVRGYNKYTLLSGKIDQNWKDDAHSSLRINTGLVSIDRQGGGLEGGVTFPSAGNRQIRNSFIAALKNSYHLGQWALESNAQYSRFRWDYARASNPDNPQATVLGPNEQPLAVLGNPGYVFDTIENTIEVQQKGVLYQNNHTIRAGIDVIFSDHRLFGGGNPVGNYTVKLSQSQLDQFRQHGVDATLGIHDIPKDVQVLNYDVELRPNSFGTWQNLYSAYVEDQFSASNRLNLTFGLRYDYDNLSKGGANHGDYNNLAPRFSFNYKLTDHSILRGGYSLVYNKIVYSVYSDALQQNTTGADYQAELRSLINAEQLPSYTNMSNVTFDGNLNASFGSVPFLQGPSSASLQNVRNDQFSNERRILNPNGYQNPYSHQFALGFQHQFGSDKLLSLDLIYSRSYNLFRLRDINSPSDYPLNDPANVVVRTQQQADATRPLPIHTDSNGPYALINGDTLRGISRDVVMTEDKGKAEYYGATLTFSGARANSPFSYLLSYTLSWSYNNTEDINFRAMDANNFAAEWGPSVNDRRHVIDASLTWYPENRFAVTGTGLFQSGQPINWIPDATRYGTTDLNGDGRSFSDSYVGNNDRWPGQSRNSGRLPWSKVIDLSIQYDIPVHDAQKLVFQADVFNLLNTTNLSGYSNNATQSNQIQVGPPSNGIMKKNAGPPRQFQFSLKYEF